MVLRPEAGMIGADTKKRMMPARPGRVILGFLDRIEDAALAGWAVDPMAADQALTMRVLVDGQIADVIKCDVNRPDTGPLNLPSTRVGFEYAIPSRFQDGLRHVLSFATLDGDPIHLPGRGGLMLPELHFCLTQRTHIEGVLDGLIDGMIQGWALRVDERTNAKTGGIRVLISTKGQPLAELQANEFRADVGEALGADPSCGFSYALPPELRNGKTIVLDFHAMPDRILLRGSPMEIAIPAEAERTRIANLIDRADELFRYAYHLRRELKAAMPAERLSLASYASWARQNQPLITQRAIARYGAITDAPLVSVLCPVFRPNQGEFLAAIDSVRAQTYQNWELILVDDASRDEALSETLERLGRVDHRIKVIVLPKNLGIAAATNQALAAARGGLVAFFDHDDVLEPCALDVMLRARSATGARLLYSDEDKIDRNGHLSEPNFKPDFNYRFLLDLNYICHLVVAETALVRELGGLDPRFDGAQDHDLLLRMSERLLAHEIHHVAEILYHWRITPASTAGGAAAKPRAALAGEVAVAEHLKRRNLPAKTERRGALTCYRTSFALDGDPGISILIPFRNHIDLTRQCVEAIRTHSEGLTIEIILLDNWSQGSEVEAFCTEQGNYPDTRILRIAEPFNYSLINNRGVATASHPFLLFMNNDVIVSDPDWLRTMLNEALADPQVGAVGAKLLYPNGTIQHAGVVLGVGGVADHAFRGLSGTAPGYIAHAIAAREVAAVTAACMLVRRSAFEAAGGFDATELGVAFNDVDLCIKIREAGYRIIFTPDVVCEHRESMSRGDDLDEDKLSRFMRENEAMRLRWEHVLPNDPFYNRHFAREGGLYRDLRRLDPEDEQKLGRPAPQTHPIAPVHATRPAPKASAGKALNGAAKLPVARGKPAKVTAPAKSKPRSHTVVD
ncbi:glycosyltransferase family 2 protein [Acidiphilium sp. PA]|uniref:glycosyltransferase family 2 protein n=1 Tax=Acidiphilium sp. PA TaxID=2871705 RepID=UPI0022434D64|nr:glycosyltransferase family 2 protein [Acidiphilium sp. PA]MCW8306644.1 glycosyltransferase family 2 protein [Acidiphilium sp. PA]